jgi:hypothetical protein
MLRRVHASASIGHARDLARSDSTNTLPCVLLYNYALYSLQPKRASQITSTGTQLPLVAAPIQQDSAWSQLWFRQRKSRTDVP